MPTILIGADLCPIEGNQPYFAGGEAESLFHDLLPEFAAADLVIANLECPLIEHPSPIRKTGPTFGVPGACINGIKAAGIDVLCLANNHIMDHGASGLKNTLAVCDNAGVATVGAGSNLEEAGRLLIRVIDGTRIAILAVAEFEFSIATKTSWGANPIDVMQFVRTVQMRRAEFDHLIVLFHGSDEFFAPTPRVQETCRFMVEMGASAVIVQHPHVLGGYERYQGGHIVYGQGALVMDEALYRNRDSFHEGFLVRLVIENSGSPDMDIVPFRQSSPGPGAKCLKGADEERLRITVAARAAAIMDPSFVEREWQKFCAQIKHGAISSLLGHGRLRRKLAATGIFERRFRKSTPFLGVRNMVLCETHREKLETIFRESC